MQQYYPRVEALFASNATSDRAAIVATHYGCAPGIVEMVPTYLNERENCRRYLREVVALAGTSHVDNVVIAACWPAYFLSFSDRQNILGPLSLGGSIPVVSDIDKAIDSLKKTISELHGADRRVYIVLSTPIGTRLDPRSLGWWLGSKSNGARFTESRADVFNALEPINSRLRKASEEAGAIVIDPLEFFCDRNTCPSASLSDHAIYYDMWSLRPTYVRDHVKYLDKAIMSP